MSSIRQKSDKMTQFDKSQIEIKGLAKQEKKEMSPFYVEDDSELLTIQTKIM